jgi:thiol-disulfide isomerase/thioredoxin
LSDQPVPKKKMFTVVIGIWAGVLLGAAVIVVLAVTGKLSPGSGSASSGGMTPLMASVDQLAPVFETKYMTGETFNLADQQGKVVVLDFWATWCGPCVREMPMLQEYQDKYPNILMLGMDEKEDAAKVKDFISKSGLKYPILLDPDGKVSELYQIMMLPTTYFIDEQGMVRFRHLGALEEDQLQFYLGALGVIK